MSTPASRSVSLVFDEGPGAGLGHRRRMEALAVALGERGLECELLPGATEAAAPIVVVDSYRVRADDRARFDADVLVAVDDLARDLDVSVLVDPSPGADPVRHQAAHEVLAGASYALVAPAEPRSVRDHVRTVLVTTGAADAAGHGAVMAGAIACAVPEVCVRLVLGPWGARVAPAGVDVVDAPDGLGAEFAAADVVVTAGGVTLLEALVRGLPAIAVETAPNQAVAVQSLAALGAVLLSDTTTITRTAVTLIDNAPLRRSLARAARATIDGHGPQRVADAISDAASRGKRAIA